MRHLKHTISIYIKDNLDILNCRHKKTLALSNLLEVQNELDENYNMNSYFVKDSSKINNVAVVKKINKFDSLNIAVVKTDLNKFLSLRLKEREQIERKHILVFFSTEEDMLVVNKNNYSYFYDIGSLLTGSFKESLLKIIMEKTK